MRHLLRTLDEQLAPPNAAIIVVDMQNDFCAEGGYLQRKRAKGSANAIRVEDNQRIAKNIGDLAKDARAAGMPVVWLRSVYDFKYLADAQIVKRGEEGCCMEGSWGADFFVIRPEQGDVIVDKHTYDGFHQTDLDARLKDRGIKTLVMTGVATNVCVDSTLRHGFFLGYNIVVAEDCVGSGNEAAHQGTLSTVRVNIGMVSDSAHLREIIVAQRAVPDATTFSASTRDLAST